MNFFPILGQSVNREKNHGLQPALRAKNRIFFPIDKTEEGAEKKGQSTTCFTGRSCFMRQVNLSAINSLPPILQAEAIFIGYCGGFKQ